MENIGGCIEKDTSLSEIFPDFGKALVSEYPWQDVLDYYHQTLRTDTQDAWGWYSKGALYESAGRIDDALVCYRTAIQLNPHEVAFYLRKAVILYYFLKQYHDAVACMDQALAIDPSLAVAWRKKGFYLMKMNDCKKALRCFEEAIAIEPHNAKVWNLKGKCLKKMGRYYDAIWCFEQALALNPDYHVALRNMQHAKKRIKIFD